MNSNIKYFEVLKRSIYVDAGNEQNSHMYIHNMEKFKNIRNKTLVEVMPNAN